MTTPSKHQPDIGLSITPGGKYDEVLLDGFAKDIAAQATRMDDLAKQLILLLPQRLTCCVPTRT